MRYTVKHQTTYTYDQPTILAYNEARMFPRQLPYQEVISSRLILEPQSPEIYYHTDFFGNRVAYFSVRESHKKFSVCVESELIRETPRAIAFDEISNVSWREVLSRLQQFRPDWEEIKMYTLPSPVVPLFEALKAYAATSFENNFGLFDAINDLNTRIFSDFEYDAQFSTVATPLYKVAEAQKGVCQDFAHFAIGCLRSYGFPARYISGYIETLTPEGEPDLIGTAASHAWFSAFIPGMGWVDFDPTNNQLAKSQHITLGWGRDYQDIPPLKGVIYNSAQHELAVAVNVRRAE